MNSLVKISIILPTFNRANKIERAVQSILRQTYQNWELIIIDDASVDNTPEILQKIKSLDQRIICIRNEKNLGLAMTPNKGLAVAKGAYIARIDDDDEWIDINKLKKQARYLDSHSRCVLLGTAFQVVDEKGKPVRVFKQPMEDEGIRQMILLSNPFGHSTVLFRKNSAMEVGRYNEALGYTEDYDLWLRLGLRGEMANLPDITVRYMEYGKSMSYSNRKNQISYRYRILKKYGNLYPKKLFAWWRLFCSFLLGNFPLVRYYYNMIYHN